MYYGGYIMYTTDRAEQALDDIRSITNNILIKCDIDGYRPIKNTTKEDCYEALYKIMYILRKYKE